MKKKIAVALLLVVVMFSTNVVMTLAVTQSDIQNKVNEIKENNSKIKEAE